jgi:hypothetical protein
MQQRRLRLGDILDDYCPRERRITNHAVVAMIDDEVKQTRCTTCDADHEYKQARVPPPRRKKDSLAPGAPNDMPDHSEEETLDDTPLADDVTVEVEAEAEGEAAPIDAQEADSVDQPASEDGGDAEDGEDVEERAPDDDGPVHRRLIRATLPRPEGQSPERKVPEFTIRQPGGRGGGREFDGNRAGGGGGGQRHGRRTGPGAGARGPQGSFSGPSRFGGGPRQNSPQGGGGQRQNGSRPGPSGGQRGGGRPQGQQRGPGRKRGR